MSSTKTFNSLDEEIKNNQELRKALDKGIDDVEAGRTVPVEQAMALLRDQINSRRGARVGA